MKYRIELKSPVCWIIEDEERIAGVHWGLHNGESSKAQQVAQKIADALNAMESKNELP